jgi:hypothetical protein
MLIGVLQKENMKVTNMRMYADAQLRTSMPYLQQLHNNRASAEVGFAKCVEKCCQLLLDPNASHQ